ncbi:MAG: helix-turn-helix transcriptional regulator [Betaproteobacteria bacterium]|nr:helix-turn-helix transcriptional regulator [Betaproteobacteria bacterium]MDH5212266.1 helix-turn-helix transcriptional regulator [Betaproteobacteria bacterium]
MGAPSLPLHRDDQAEAAYLGRLGDRVRAWRAEHAMTRKSLALASGVSERYLAQLESGRGNISVLLLRKLSHAMQVPVELLVREHADTGKGQRIALIGLRGAGKSTLGAKLAQALDMPFIELDREVEKQAGAPLDEVFSMYGQEAFRRFERSALARVLREAPRAVIATGGSLVTDPDTYNLLLDECTCVWLKATPEEHMARVMAQGDVRPFKGSPAAQEEIRRLLADRDRLYARADAVLDTSARPVKHSLAELKALVAKETA